MRNNRQLFNNAPSKLFNNATNKLFAPTSQIRFNSTAPKSNKDEEPKEYTIKFTRGFDVKKEFKQLYSLYGPVFIGCHIGVSLISLGFFSSLVWLSVDLEKILPTSVIDMAGKQVVSMTGSGGKFVIAYAIHKVILPIRLGIAVMVTRYLSLKIKKIKNKK